MTDLRPPPMERKLYHIEGDIWLVPCKANHSGNKFQPLLQPISEDEAFIQISKLKGWSQADDDLLLQLVTTRGAKSWSLIAYEMNSILHGGKQIKIGRQCRERWYNHVDPNLKKGNWTLEEDIFLIETQRKIGNKWSEIAKGLTGRTENSVKNRWKSLLKQARREWPQNFDMIGLLLAQKKGRAIETNNGINISILSPVISSRTAPELPAQSMSVAQLPAEQTTEVAHPVADNSRVNAVRNLLSNLTMCDPLDTTHFTFDTPLGDPEGCNSPSMFLQ